MLRYLQIFNFLWRAKRIEFILAGMWRNHMMYQRQLRSLPGKLKCLLVSRCHVIVLEVQFCLHQCQLITGSLVHFISQLQYYIMFEVIIIMLS